MGKEITPFEYIKDITEMNSMVEKNRASVKKMSYDDQFDAFVARIEKGDVKKLKGDDCDGK